MVPERKGNRIKSSVVCDKTKALGWVETHSSELNVQQHIIYRTVSYDIEPIVCMSKDSEEDVIEQIANKENIKCYRGSLVRKFFDIK